MTVYGAAVLDVVASKSSANRAELQARLNEAIGGFNERFQAILSVPAGITVGDEWEFLTVRPSHSYELVQWFQEALRPQGVELYAGLGIGGLRTPPAADIRQMDGPCFHLARRAVEIAKESGGSRHKRIFSKRNRVYLLAEESAAGGAGTRGPGGREAAAAHEDEVLAPQLSLQEIANAMIENTEILKARMTGKQRQVFVAYQRCGSYRRMVMESGPRQTTGGISQKLNSAEYFVIRRNGQLIGTLLDAIAKSLGQ